MRKRIKWTPPTELLEKGYPPELTGGILVTESMLVYCVVFQELIEIDGKMVVPRIYLRDYPDLEKLVFMLMNEEREEDSKMVVHLVDDKSGLFARGCPWAGDITRTDEEILEQCRYMLSNKRGLSDQQRLQPDDEILAKIHTARQKWASRPARIAAARLSGDKGLLREIREEAHEYYGYLRYEDFVNQEKWIEEMQR